MAKQAAGQFPSLCCGVCCYAHPDKEGDLACYVDPGRYITDGTGGITATPRGVDIEDKLAPACEKFKARMHA